MLDIQEVADTIGSLPKVLRALLEPIDPAALSARPEPGEWCVLEVIGHLIACDQGAFRGRIAGIIAGEPEIAGFDAWAAINKRDFAGESLNALLAELTAERETSSAFLLSLDPSDLAKTASNPAGKFAAGDFVHEWPFHDQDHLRQILEALKQSYLPHMTATMREALSN